MTTVSTARIFTLVLLCISSLYQSVAYPLNFDKILNTHSILKARSLGTEQLQRRAFTPVMGEVATTVFGNAIGGALGPIFEEIGTSLSSGMSGQSHESDGHGHEEEVIEYQTLHGPYERKNPYATSRSKSKQNTEESQEVPVY